MKNQQKVLGRLETKMENMATKEDLEAVKATLTEKIENLAQDLESLAMATSQDIQTLHAKIDQLGIELGGRMDKVEYSMDQMDSRTSQIESKMATKTDLRASEQRMMDYTDKRMHQAEEKILGAVRREDEKVDEHIRASEHGGVFDLHESKRLQNLGPFIKLA